MEQNSYVGGMSPDDDTPLRPPTRATKRGTSHDAALRLGGADEVDGDLCNVGKQDIPGLRSRVTL